MNILVVDDEKIVLADEVDIIGTVVPEATIHAFNKPAEALKFAETEPLEIAFLDINMRVINGIDFAKKLQAINPKINIIFCTGYKEFSLDAHDLFCSGYLLKPLDESKVQKVLDNLRFQVGKQKRIVLSCFGNFSVFIDGQPAKFKYKKTNEFLAYLVDRNGTDCSSREIMSIIFEDEDKVSYYDNMRIDLLSTFKACGLNEVIRQERGTLGIDRNAVECDYFDYLDNKNDTFHGEYMTQYSWAEQTLQNLINLEEKRKQQ